MDVDKADILANFMAIANASDEATAINILEATDWVLDDAVNLFFASGEAPQGMGGTLMDLRARAICIHLERLEKAN